MSKVNYRSVSFNKKDRTKRKSNFSGPPERSKQILEPRARSVKVPALGCS